jgi:hypothetical protein
MFFWLRFLDGNSRNQQDAASGVYFFGTKSMQTLKPTDMIAFYEQQGRVKRLGLSYRKIFLDKINHAAHSSRAALKC